jgi:general secretion pathway protein G
MIVRSNRAARRLAFTLMEVLVVVAILVILAGVGGVMYMRYLDEAKVSKAKIDIKALADVVETYYLKNNEYPASLVILTQPQDGERAYLEPQAIMDPWSHEYMIEPNTVNPATGKPLIYSNGPGGGGQQIRSWQ